MDSLNFPWLQMARSEECWERLPCQLQGPMLLKPEKSSASATGVQNPQESESKADLPSFTQEDEENMTQWLKKGVAVAS